MFSRCFFILRQFHQNIGRDASRLYTLLCCVHSGKGCIRLRHTLNNMHLITICFAGATAMVARIYARERFAFSCGIARCYAGREEKKMVRKFFRFVFMVLLVGMPTHAVAKETIDVGNLKNDGVCVEIREDIGQLLQEKPDELLALSYTRLYGILRKQDPNSGKAAEEKTFGRLYFYPSKVKNFSFLRDGKITNFWHTYYTLDLTNTGKQQTVEFIPEDNRDTIWVYREAWTGDIEPIDFKKVLDEVLDIDHKSFWFLGSDLGYFPFHFYIYPFSIHGKNLLLLEGNTNGIKKENLHISSGRYADVIKYIVIEVTPKWKISPVCALL